MDKEAYQIYLLSDHWKAKREQRLKYDGYRCLFCGSGDSLNVHHLHYNSLWNESVEFDLVTLCRDCHKRFHECIDMYTPEIKEINRQWQHDANNAIKDIAIKYRTQSGNHLASVIHRFIGDKPNKNIAKIIKVFMLCLDYKAGYTEVHPHGIKENTYSIAAQKLSALRKKKAAQG